MSTIEKFHIECNGCGKLWPEGSGYGACNILWEDVPRGWTLGDLPIKDPAEDAVSWYGRAKDYCPDCRPPLAPVEVSRRSTLGPNDRMEGI